MRRCTVDLSRFDDTFRGSGRAAAFVVGWMAWVTMILSWAAVANALPGYVGALAPSIAHPIVSRAIVVALIVAPAALNYFGIRPGAYANNAFTIAKLVPLVAFVAVGVFFVDWDRVAFVPTTGTAGAPWCCCTGK